MVSMRGLQPKSQSDSIPGKRWWLEGQDLRENPFQETKRGQRYMLGSNYDRDYQPCFLLGSKMKGPVNGMKGLFTWNYNHKSTYFMKFQAMELFFSASKHSQIWKATLILKTFKSYLWISEEVLPQTIWLSGFRTGVRTRRAWVLLHICNFLPLILCCMYGSHTM